MQLSPALLTAPAQPLLLAAWSVTTTPPKTWLERVQERDTQHAGKGWGKGNHTRVVKRKKGAA